MVACKVKDLTSELAALEEAAKILNLAYCDFDGCWEYVYGTMKLHETGRYPQCLIIRRNGFEVMLFRRGPEGVTFHHQFLRTGSVREVPEQLTAETLAQVLRVY